MSEAVKRVKELFKMPQKLCRQCGQCCKVVCFKNGLTYDEVKNLATQDMSSSNEPSQIEGAKDFLAIFKPYKSLEEAKANNPDLVEKFQKKTKKEKVEADHFYCCRFLTKENKCLIHEDRPTLCRMYPIPNEGTIFYNNCGYEKQAKKNLKEINDIIEKLKG